MSYGTNHGERNPRFANRKTAPPKPTTLLTDKHVSYIYSLDKDRDSLEYILTAHLRMSGLFWGLTALCLLGHPPKDVIIPSIGENPPSRPPQEDRAPEPDDEPPKPPEANGESSVSPEATGDPSSSSAITASSIQPDRSSMTRADLISFTLSCQHPSGGFGASPTHDPHLLYTTSAIQILATCDALHTLDDPSLSPCKTGRSGVASWIATLQDRNTGCFAGDEWGEYDNRFIYCAFVSLSLLGEMRLVDVEKAVSFIQRCGNFDGGYGLEPDAESHAGQVFTCVGALAISAHLHLVDIPQTARWLSERQLENGGLNGRPEKLEDVCYSWWVMASLAMIGKLHWIDQGKVTEFILSAQDEEGGGLADRPGDLSDVFHTHFGLAGLSLVRYTGVGEVDPRYSMPKGVVERVLRQYDEEHDGEMKQRTEL